MSVTETALCIDCEGEQCIGILTRPKAHSDTAVLVIVGGPQYRAGSHRQFVHLARALARAGYPVLRFDYRGMGDAAGPARDFSQVSADVAAALDALQRELPEVRRVALWGLCDGASAALMYWHDTRDPRVTAMCLLNPWVRSEASLARTHVKHYYRQRLMQRDFWLKLLSGKVAFRAAAGLVSNLRLSLQRSASGGQPVLPFQQRMAQGWRSFRGGILLLLSAEDFTAREFTEYAGAEAAWSGLLQLPHVQRHDLAGADHTFSSAALRAAVESLTLQWLQLQGQGSPATAARALP